MASPSDLDYLSMDEPDYLPGDSDATDEELAERRRLAQQQAAILPIQQSPAVGAPPPATPPDSALASAIDRRTQLMAGRPTMPKPKWWQRALAGGMGAAVGAANARGNINPIDPTAAEQTILAPGYGRRLQDWNQQVAQANTAVQGEQAKVAAQKSAADATEQQARAQMYGQQAKTMAEEGKRRVIVRKDGSVVDSKSGAIITPAPEDFNAKVQQYKTAGFDQREATLLAIGGSSAAAQLARPEKPEAAAKAKDAFQATLSKIAAEGGLPQNAMSNAGALSQAIRNAKTITPDEKNSALAYLASNTTPAGTATAGVLRIEALGQTRGVAMLDTKNGNTPVEVPWTEISRANREDPGRYIPAAQGAQALNRTSLLEDIRGSINQTRQSLSTIPEFSLSDKAKIAMAMRDRDPRSAISQLIGGASGASMTPEQQDYLIDLAQLQEQAMAMRSVLGAGQGSEDLRSAILRTIPGPGTPSNAYARKQLDRFEATLNRLSRGVPKVPLRNEAGQASGGGGGSVVDDLVKKYGGR